MFIEPISNSIDAWRNLEELFKIKIEIMCAKSCLVNAFLQI